MPKFRQAAGLKVESMPSTESWPRRGPGVLWLSPRGQLGLTKVCKVAGKAARTSPHEHSSAPVRRLTETLEWTLSLVLNINIRTHVT